MWSVSVSCNSILFPATLKKNVSNVSIFSSVPYYEFLIELTLASKPFSFKSAVS